MARAPRNASRPRSDRARRLHSSRRRRRRSQRAARRAGQGHRHRDHRCSRGGFAPCRSRSPESRSNRHRARHRHRGRQPRADRGDDAEARHRDVRAPCTRHLHHRLGRGRAPPRLHDERALLRRRRHDPRSARRLSRSRVAPRPLHWRPARSHPRGLSAHPALLPLHRRIHQRTARRAGSQSLDRARARVWAPCRASASTPSSSAFSQPPAPPRRLR